MAIVTRVKLSLLVWIVVAAGSGCATRYAYNFEHAVVDDGMVTAEIQVWNGAIDMALTNRTHDVLQVDWSNITVDRGDDSLTALHPATDLGWIQPGATAKAQLVPFVLPRTGDAAARYQGRRLELVVPTVANHEPKTYRIQVIAHVRPE